MADEATPSRGVNVKDVAAGEFVLAYAAHLKRIGKIEVPKWADLVKTSTAKELAPYNPDWYYVRAASLARKIYLRGGTGVGAFTKVYGGSSHKTVRTPHFHKACGGLIRHIMQQLGEIDIVAKKADSTYPVVSAASAKAEELVRLYIVGRGIGWAFQRWVPRFRAGVARKLAKHFRPRGGQRYFLQLWQQNARHESRHEATHAPAS